MSSSTTDSIVILGAARTPMGGFQGDFSSLAAHDLGGAAPFQYSADFVQGRAGGHHVVQHGDFFSGEIKIAGKRPAHIASALLPFQSGLARGVAGAPAGFGHERNVQPARNLLGDFQRLIEAALLESLRMERHRQQQVGLGMLGGEPRQGFCQHFDERKIARIFKRVQQTINREAVTECRQGAVKSWRMPQAGAAQIAALCGKGACRAGGGPVMGEVGVATRA